MLYSKTDMEQNAVRARKECMAMTLCALPFAAFAAAGFMLRNEVLCTVCATLFFSVLIALIELRLLPILRYGRFLSDVTGGLSHETAGTLVRIGSDEVYEEGVYFSELIINIYEDMAQEGERRFLLDRAKVVSPEWIGQDVSVVSHGNVVLDVKPLHAVREEVL